ncbi:MAG TPA: aspartate aminotransferase family protein [Minicystis sp.]|nr:aspartate aminotransferase family protein [Minicystis sp.]
MSAPVRAQPTDQRALIRTEVPGPKSRRLRMVEDAHAAPGLQRYATSSGIVVDRARGSAVTDVDGNTYLDLVGGIGTGSLGHAHPRFVSAVAAQAERMAVGSFTSEARVELLTRFAAHPPAPGLTRMQLYSSGAEAVESALRLAKSATGKHEFVSFWGGFHGKTMGALSLMGTRFKHGLGPMVPGAHLVPYADCYRCPLALSYPSCGLACVEVAKKQLEAASTGSIAAFVIEPMQGSAGNVVPPPEFLPAVAELAREHGALLIADEMITGFGRTGRWFGVDHTGVRPDVVTLGKGMGGGFPVSAVATTDAIASARPWSEPSGSSSSYGGNPLAAAAAAAVLATIEDEALVDNARDVGRAMRDMLLPFVERYPFVGEVRGQGLLLAIELVRDKETKEPLSRDACSFVFREAVARGLLAMAYAPRVRLQPALTIDAATAANAVEILREVFDALARSGAWR